MRSPEADAPRDRRPVVALLLAALAIAFVAVVLLLPYAGKEEPGRSYDTPYYVWRTRAVASDGLGVLTTIPTGAVPERPGVPVLGATLGDVIGSDALTYTVILRAIAAVAIGLAAGAMALEALREARWAFAAFVVGLGASAAVVGTAVGSLDQLLVEVLLVAAAAVVPLVAAGRRGVVVVGVVFAAAAATHWVFAALFLLLLAAVALALVPGSVAARRSGAAWATTSSIRLFRAVLVASAAAVATLALLPTLPDHLPPAIGDRGNQLRLAAYELPLVLPLAALGFVLTFRRSDGSRRTTLVLLGLWAATVPIAMAVSALLPTPIKLFRVAPFALGVPALLTVGLVTVADRAGSRLGRRGTIVGALVLAGGLAWTSGSPVSSFGGSAAASIAERMAQARTAGRYLDGIPRSGRPVIFLTQGNPRLLDRAVRSAVPPDMIPDTWVFVGRADDLAARGPVDDPERARLSALAQKWWTAAWPNASLVFARDPIVIRIGPAGPTPPGGADGVELAPGVEVLVGPPPPPSFEPPAPFRVGWMELLLASGLALVVLTAVGGGWVRSVLDVSGLAAFGLAPAFGVAAIVLVGTAASRLGLSLGSGGGWLIVLATAASGWIVLALGGTVSRRRSATRAQGPPVG
ncbi:MAG: hypothetical protein K0R20_345 [Actinomycetia bacterium]|nr:hypothetical protein [Actinomycetes bacterium]